jgi:hypothetical protein
MENETLNWLLQSDEPWTRYRTYIDILDRDEEEPEVQAARAKILNHPQIKGLIADCKEWPGYALKRHNDAKHILYKFSTLADIGVRHDDPGMQEGVKKLISHYAPEGAYQTLVSIPRAFGGTDEDMWTWVLCDTPTILYALAAMGWKDEKVEHALEYLQSLVHENGWGCKAADELGKFKGPGRREDPCPMANVYVLKALSTQSELLESEAAKLGIEMLLGHWERQTERKLYLFGIGTDFRKLKYPFVWYDILHVVEVLSRYPRVHKDPRFIEMVETITNQADEEGRYTAGSMYMAWKGWSFANKKEPSPWLTFLVMRMLKRINK